MILKNILLIILSAFTFNISSFINEDKYYTFNPNNIATNSPLEIELTHNFGIGRHEMIEIKDWNDQGIKEVQSLSEVYDGDSFENFELELTVKSMTEQSLLIHSSYSMNIAKAIGFKAGLEGFSMNANIQQTNTFNIGISQQYTYGKEVDATIRYDIKNDVIKGKKFNLCRAGKVYELNCTTWKWDDYWWGDYEVEGSRRDFKAYLIVDLYNTIAFENGELA